MEKNSLKKKKTGNGLEGVVVGDNREKERQTRGGSAEGKKKKNKICVVFVRESENMT